MISRRIILGVMCLAGLIAVRFFETELFYDPLKSFFNGAYQTQGLPKMNWPKWMLNLFFRYAVNTLLSLSLLQLIFAQSSVVKFSAMLYALIFLVLTSGLMFLTYDYIPGEYRALFYVRRFLIHPVILLLLIPSFYVLSPKKNS